MIVKYAISNVGPETLAKLAQDAGLSGSVYSGYGFGAWDVERTSFLEFATDNLAMYDEFVRKVLVSFNETAAFRIIDGKAAALVYHNTTMRFV